MIRHGLIRKVMLNNILHNRDGGIRTRDPLNPIQVRYRTALRPVYRSSPISACSCRSDHQCWKVLPAVRSEGRNLHPRPNPRHHLLPK